MKYIVYLIMVLGWISCTPNKTAEVTNTFVPGDENSVTLTAEQEKSAGISAALPERKEMVRRIQVFGTVEVPPGNRVSLSMPLGGFVKSVNVLPGAYVQKGAVLAVMEDPQYVQLQQDYLTARAELDLATKELDRQKELNVSRAGSDKVLQQAQNEFTRQRVAVRALGEKLRLIQIDPDRLTDQNLSASITLRSPIQGVVSSIHVTQGKYVTPSEVMLDLLDASDMYLAIKVFEKDVEDIRIGQKIQAFRAHEPEIIFGGEVVRIGRDLSDERTLNVYGSLESGSNTLIPGTYLNVWMDTQPSLEWVVPEEAVVSDGEGEYVFVSDGSRQYHMVKVNIGIHEGGQVALMDWNGEENKSVVIRGAYTLFMAARNRGE